MSDRHPARTGSVAILALHAMIFGALTWWSWRKWPDPLIDFGRELYVPWQIGEGRVLYRDLSSLFGPLSPYVNALWFRAFGVSLTTLVICNLIIFAALLAGVYHLVRTSTDRLTATLATVTAMLLFGFSQYVIIGNYNFATPYSHEATHGLALGVATLVAFHEAVARRRPWLFAVAGVCFGLVLLTKPETAIAAACGVAAGVAAAATLGSARRAAWTRAAALFVFGAAAAPLAFFVYFRTQMTAADALRSVGGAWVPLWKTGIAAGEFYRRGMGLDDPAGNALRMVRLFGGVLAFVGAAVAASWPRGPRGRVVARLARVGLLIFAILAVRWDAVPRALPLTTATALSVFAWLFARRRQDRDGALALLPLLMWSAFALALLLKMGLNARFYTYGFYLALPATTVLIVLVAWTVPHLLEMGGRAGTAAGVRQIAIWTIAAAIAPYLGVSHGWYRAKVLPVGSGADRFLASSTQWQGVAVRDALQDIEDLSSPADTVAVLPEGVMLDYLARRRTPMRAVNLMPPELLAFGEEGVLRSLETAPPKLIVLVAKDTAEYGYPPFGTTADYGLRIVRWVDSRYEQIDAAGPRLPGGEPAIRIFRRRD